MPITVQDVVSTLIVRCSRVWLRTALPSIVLFELQKRHLSKHRKSLAQC